MGKKQKKTSKPAKARVLDVIDGDTFRASLQGAEVTVRLACIDAPELAQAPWGEQSKDALTGLMSVGSTVLLNKKTTDQYGRIVAEASTKKGVNYGEEMLRLGQAFIYDEYASQCNTKSLYLAEATAQESGLGLWSEANLVMPWDFRSGSAPTPEPTQEPETDGSTRSIPPFQGSREITCSEIPSREIALEWLKAGHAYLDADGDGCPCETQFGC